MANASASCVSFSVSSSVLTVSSPSTLNLPSSSSFVTRKGSKLYLDGREWKAVGANIYWLGLDENIGNTISWPGQGRVLEMFATVAAMGGTSVRSHTLGTSVGHPLSIMPTLGVYNEQALRVVDFAIYAARLYGIRLVIPFTDNYGYYHGGKYSFLSFRNISLSQPSQFYTNSDVISDFKQYIGTILNRTNTYTNITYARDPTIAIWETGNELTGVPVAWTSDLSAYIKSLAPSQLIMDGSYGVQQDALGVASVDISNHYYPLSQAKVKDDAATVAGAGKAYYIGEFDWTQRYKNLSLLACLIPLVFVAIAFCLPSRWFPWTVSVPKWVPRRKKAVVMENQDTKYVPLDGESTLDPDSKEQHAFPPTLDLANSPLPSGPRRFYIRKWMFALSFLLLVPFAALIALKVGPTSLQTFLGTVERTDGVVGSAYWSLFGRDDACCAWVQHNDAFTLHYRDPQFIDPSFALAQHAYAMSGRVAAFDTNNADLLPVILCPQRNVTF